MQMTNTAEPHHLLDHLLAFGRLLRQFGVPVDPGQMLDLLAGLEHIAIGDRHDVYLASRALLVRRREDLPVFDEAWEFFWASRRRNAGQGQVLPGAPTEELRVPRRLQRRREEEPPDERPEAEREELELQLTWSRAEQLREKDFARFTADELDQARELIAAIGYRMAWRRVRRLRPGRGRRVDARRALRGAIRTGGEILALPRLEPKLKQRPLVVLCDISGSMDRYSRVLIQFAYAVSQGLRSVEAFVFGTRLTRITRLLEHRDIDEAVTAVGGGVLDWGGGTRIGEAIKAFNWEWGRRVLGRGAVVLLISDGWDRGDPELLGRETARLQRTSHRLLWLNPLLGMPGYQPLTRGMQAALPFVDDFLPVHNLQSLEQLGEKLGETLRR